MSLTISQVRNWNLGGLSNTAAGLRSGADTMSDAALTVINKLAGVGADYQGETRDATEVHLKDHAGQLTEKSQRWNNAANVLDQANKELAGFHDAILSRADNPENLRRFAIGDDGSITIREDYKQAEGEDLLAEALQLSAELRSLLATAELSAQREDWLVTNALMGVSEAQRPFVPSIPPPPANAGNNTRDSADHEGNGPKQYRSWIDPKPGTLDKMRLEATRLALAEMAAGYSVGGTLATLGSGDIGPIAQGLLGHFLKNDGSVALIDVNQLLIENSAFSTAVRDYTKSTVQIARSAMPPGYTGPIAFQSPYGGKFDTSATTNPDYYLGLAHFSYQVSGVATPSTEGNYSIAARTSVYDYYNFSTTGPLSVVNDMHRAGWAQNFDVMGTSTTRSSTWP